MKKSFLGPSTISMVPFQGKEWYSKEYSAAVNIASAPTRMLIPPSNTLIVYSTVADGDGSGRVQR